MFLNLRIIFILSHLILNTSSEWVKIPSLIKTSVIEDISSTLPKKDVYQTTKKEIQQIPPTPKSEVYHIASSTLKNELYQSTSKKDNLEIATKNISVATADDLRKEILNEKRKKSTKNETTSKNSFRKGIIEKVKLNKPFEEKSPLIDLTTEKETIVDHAGKGYSSIDSEEVEVEDYKEELDSMLSKPTVATVTEKINKNESLLPILKNIQQTLIGQKTGSNSLSNKLEILNQIKKEILVNIRERINHLMPSEDDEINRSKRELVDRLGGGGLGGIGGFGSNLGAGVGGLVELLKEKIQHDHHYDELDETGPVDFPSNAGALLAISFLTFAVYLIKLILNVIHFIKIKSQNPNLFFLTTTPPTYFKEEQIGGKSILDETTEKMVLNAINSKPTKSIF